MFGGRQHPTRTKSSNARVGMKKQPVWDKENHKVGGSSPKKQRCSVATKRLAQTETDRDTEFQKWSRDFWALDLCCISGQFWPRYATSEILCLSQIGVLNQFVQVLINNDPFGKIELMTQR